MEAQEPGREKERTRIPEVFYSDKSSKPFENCILCDKFLLEKGTLYVIEKAIRRYEKFNTTDTIFEYAMCLSCYADMWKSFSDSSKAKMQEYFDKNVNLDAQRARLAEKESLRVDDLLSRCFVKGTAVEEMSQYQICCQCDGSEILPGSLPLMISGEVADEIANLLSNKTLGEIGGFMDEFISLPPELEKSPHQPVFVM